MVSNALSYASDIICAISMCIYLRMVYQANPWGGFRGEYNSVYKWSINYIFITQSIGVVVGSVGPIFRCFTLLSFKSFSNQNMKHFKVFKVEKYWTQKLCEWKESCISLLSKGNCCIMQNNRAHSYCEYYLCHILFILYVNIRRATLTLWHEVEHKCKWLRNTIERIAYEGKTPKEVIKSLAHMAEEIVNEINTRTNGEPVEKENPPLKLIAANSMHRIAQTILHTYESNNLEITEDELFTRLSEMIADILAACLTNIPQAVIMRCHESVIEKREASVLAAINLFGRTTEIIKGLETHELPNMDPDKMGFIDEWRLHLKQP
ncbi:hypothetical protein HanPI659440_Chr06g0233281 [Helianthus annuus]|nr:hypothetical protein HanPI659440_Chr06g0233281 [Helianthus annuus]